MWKMTWLVVACCMLQAQSGCVLLEWALGSEGGGGRDPEEVKNEDPKIRPGFALRVGVTASGAVIVPEALKEVDINGDIQMPYIGAVKCEDHTIVQLQEKIVEAYKEFYLNPQATVGYYWDPRMETPSPWGTVLVMGAVLRPGQVNVPPTRDLTLTRVLMLSGNITPLGDKSKVWVSHREADGKIKRVKVNLEKMAKRGDPKWDIPVHAGDVVWVPESLF